MKYEYMHPREQIVTIMRRVYGYGMTTTSGGNISILEDESGDIWITPGRHGQGPLVRRISCGCGATGSWRALTLLPPSILFTGPSTSGVPTSAPCCTRTRRRWWHSASCAGSRTQASFPRHAPLRRRGVRPLCDPRLGRARPQSCGSIRPGLRHRAPGKPRRGRGGHDLLEAFQRFETLDFCARTLINASALGAGPRPGTRADRPFPTGQELPAAGVRSAIPLVGGAQPPPGHARAGASRLPAAPHDQHGGHRFRAGGRGLFPDQPLRRGPQLPRRVRFRAGARRKARAGHRPQPRGVLHQEIYAAQPKINAIASAQSPAVTAFSVTGSDPGQRDHPRELRRAARHPAGALRPAVHRRTRAGAGDLAATPVALLENDAVLTTAPRSRRRSTGWRWRSSAHARC